MKKVTLKDYQTGKVSTVDIANSPNYGEWFRGLSFGPAIHQDNRVAFRVIFGRKPDWHFGRGTGEFDQHVWVQEYEGDTYLLFTAKGKGTSIEQVMQGGGYKVNENAVNFAASLQEELEGWYGSK